MQLKFHPLAELFPLMDGAEFDALVADISEHGLREPIVLHDDQILDGRNRYRACQEAEIEPIYEEWDCNGSIQAFVISKNLHRRHLNESQRAMIAAKLANIARGEVGGGHPKTEGHMSISAAAELLNVSRTSVNNAKTVLQKGTEEEVAAIESGLHGARPLADQIRASVPKEKRTKSREQSLSQSGKNPERIQRQQLNAEIWGRIRDTLTNLTSLPLPADAAAIARGNNNAAGFVDARLEKSLQWLTEFSDAWNANV